MSFKCDSIYSLQMSRTCAGVSECQCNLSPYIGIFKLLRDPLMYVPKSTCHIHVRIVPHVIIRDSKYVVIYRREAEHSEALNGANASVFPERLAPQ